MASWVEFQAGPVFFWFTPKAIRLYLVDSPGKWPDPSSGERPSYHSKWTQKKHTWRDERPASWNRPQNGVFANAAAFFTPFSPTPNSKYHMILSQIQSHGTFTLLFKWVWSPSHDETWSPFPNAGYANFCKQFFTSWSKSFIHLLSASQWDNSKSAHIRWPQTLAALPAHGCSLIYA